MTYRLLISTPALKTMALKLKCIFILNLPSIGVQACSWSRWPSWEDLEDLAHSLKW